MTREGAARIALWAYPPTVRAATGEEIAHELACPLGTIKVRLHRARKKLGAALGRPVG